MLQAPAERGGDGSAATSKAGAAAIAVQGSVPGGAGPAAEASRHGSPGSPPCPEAPVAEVEPKMEQTDTSSGPSDLGPSADAAAAMLAIGHSAAPGAAAPAAAATAAALPAAGAVAAAEANTGAGASTNGVRLPLLPVKRKADLLGQQLLAAAPPPGPPPPQVALGLALQRQAAALQQAALQHHGFLSAEEVGTSYGEGGGTYSSGLGMDQSNVSGESGAAGEGAGKKARLVWTQELHNRFINALSHLGLKHAVPKNILTMMNVEGMSRENVASHLQKYRLYLKKLGGHTEKDKVDSDDLQKLHEKNVQQMAQQQAMQQQLTAALASYQRGYPGGPGAAAAGFGTVAGMYGYPPTVASAPHPAAAEGPAGAAAAAGGAVEQPTGTECTAGTAAGGSSLEAVERTSTSAPAEGPEADTASFGTAGADKPGQEGGCAEGIPVDEPVEGVPVTSPSLPPGAAVGQPVSLAMWHQQPPPSHVAAWQQYQQQYAQYQQQNGADGGGRRHWQYPPPPPGEWGGRWGGGGGGASAAAVEQELSVELQDIDQPVTTNMPLHHEDVLPLHPEDLLPGI